MQGVGDFGVVVVVAPFCLFGREGGQCLVWGGEQR